MKFLLGLGAALCLGLAVGELIGQNWPKATALGVVGILCEKAYESFGKEYSK